MKNKYQLFLAFFIPFSAALLLICGYSYFFPVYQPTDGRSFGIYPEELSLEKQIYGLLILSMFILSLILPAIVDLRKDPVERTELKLTGKEK